MQNAVCPHCKQDVAFPDGLARGHCVHCGGVVEWYSASATGIQTTAAPEWIPPDKELPREKRTEPYADWEDFRSNSAVVQLKLAELATRALPDLRRAALLPVPEEAPQEADAWGRPCGTLVLRGDSRLTTVAVNALLWGIGLLVLVSGAAMLLNPPDEPKKPRRGDVSAPIKAVVIVAIGAACLTLGAWYAFLRRARHPTTFWVFENGLVRQEGRDFLACPWEDVESFHVNLSPGKADFWLRVGGHDMQISAAVDPSVLPLMEYIEIKLTAALFLPMLRRIFAGERLKFGAVSIDKVGFEGPRFYAFWSDVERVVCDPDFMFVVRREATDWYRMRYADASFPLLILALAHVLTEEIKLLPGAPIESRP